MSKSVLPLHPCIFTACTRITLPLPISCLFRLQLFFCRKDEGTRRSQKTCHSISVYAERRCKLPRFLYLSKSHNFQFQLFTECLVSSSLQGLYACEWGVKSDSRLTSIYLMCLSDVMFSETETLHLSLTILTVVNVNNTILILSKF
jgi:hypothetical protein